MTNDTGPGVPEALPTTLYRIVEQLGLERIDRLWIFPPLMRGRREWGLVAASVYTDNLERRRLHSASYTAECTGQGLSVVHDLKEQGDAPPDRFHRVMEGVVLRAADELGEPREIVLEGKSKAFEEMMANFDPKTLEYTPA
ncbi:MAG TPA: hypothetical protein DIU18_01890 [Gemmatimonadetes bacterium]|nr:hypothetical protein [Gemmatimonadota bacterium]